MDGGESSAELAAGEFSSWLDGMEASLRGEQDADVPCAGCTACCTASQFIHISPDETDALAHIPKALLFPAPRLPRGHVLLGYDERGHCPMLVDGGCSIYGHRPRTCRTYDCRVFPAAGLLPDEIGKEGIAERAARWRFDVPSHRDRVEHDAVRAAASFVGEHAGELPDGFAPATATARAVLAIELHGSFLGNDPGSGERSLVTPDVDTVRVALRRLDRRSGAPR